MAQVDSENSTAMPANDAGALFRRTDISPEALFQALGRVRRAARAEIEALISWLDSTIDTDEDSAGDDEPCDDRELEPSLGSFDRMSDQIKAWQGDNGDVDAELDNCDREPSLGSVGDVHFNQERWSEGDSRDIEIAEGDDEPSLGTHHLPSGAVCYLLLSDSLGHIDVEGEHDGREPGEDDEPSLCGSAEMAGAGGDDRDLEGEREDDEPSLGWTVDGVIANTSEAGCDREEGGSAVPPQNRTEIDRKPLTVEVSYRRFLRGLTPDQREAMEARRRQDSGVSLVGGPAWGER